MKKVLFFATCAIALFASCQKTEVNYVGEPQEIAFFAVNKTATKAPHSATTFPDDNMQVAAYLAAGGTAVGDFFTQTQFTKKGTYWTGSKYWPITASTINFLAVSEPVVAADKTNPVSYATTPFTAASATVTLDGDAQYDLMYAVGQGECEPGTYPKVDMQFRHSLAWLYFTVKANLAGKIKVNSITVNDTAVDGTLTITNSNSTATTTVATATATVGADWGTVTRNVNMAVPATAVECVAADTEYDFGSLLVIPDGAAGAELTATAKSFTINYTVDNGSKTTYEYTHEFEAAWEMAKKYTYDISIKLTGIEVNPTVTDWNTTPGSTPVNLEGAPELS